MMPKTCFSPKMSFFIHFIYLNTISKIKKNKSTFGTASNFKINLYDLLYNYTDL